MTHELPDTNGFDRCLRPAFDHATCGQARVVVAESLEQAGVRRDHAVVAVVVLGEMLSNAVRHGRPRDDGDLEVRWSLGEDELHVAVRDGGCAEGLAAALPRQRAESGRGLWMLEQLAREWGVSTTHGTEVWGILPAARQA